jgi:F-type H+-transporting ATPase subunit epsilon
MANTFTFELVSPERLLLASNDVVEVGVPGADGYFTVMANHAPFMSTIKPGIVSAKRADGQVARYVVMGGFADVSATGCAILAEKASPAGEVSAADMDAAIAAAKDAAANAASGDDMAHAAAYLDSLVTLKASL